MKERLKVWGYTGVYGVAYCLGRDGLERSEGAEKILHQGKDSVESVPKSQLDVGQELLKLQDRTTAVSKQCTDGE